MKTDVSFELASKTITEKPPEFVFPSPDTYFLKLQPPNSGSIRCFNSLLKERFLLMGLAVKTIKYTKNSTFCRCQAYETVLTGTRAAGDSSRTQYAAEQTASFGMCFPIGQQFLPSPCPERLWKFLKAEGVGEGQPGPRTLHAPPVRSRWDKNRHPLHSSSPSTVPDYLQGWATASGQRGTGLTRDLALALSRRKCSPLLW